MKVRIITLFTSLIFTFCILKAQNIELIRYDKYENYNKECSKINDCIESIELKKQYLIFSIYTRKPSRIIARSLDYKMKHDTLVISYNEPILYTIRDRICEVLTFEFGGFSKIPDCLIYNTKVLHTCPISYLSYSIFKGDTINIINKNGFKEGKWIDFYETGEIGKIKEYKNGQFVKGNLYDKSGKITHIVSEEGIEMAIPLDVYNETH